MDVTRNLARYVNDKSINLSDLARKTKIPYSCIYKSLGTNSKGKRQLRADEFMAICQQLNIDPLDLK